MLLARGWWHELRLCELGEMLNQLLTRPTVEDRSQLSPLYVPTISDLIESVWKGLFPVCVDLNGDPASMPIS
jgi:hypothetical protein